MMDEGGEPNRKSLAREFLDYSRPSVGKPCGNDHAGLSSPTPPV